MLTNQYYHPKIYNFLATSCLVLFAVIAILAGSTSWAIAQELSPTSGRTGEINQKSYEDRSQVVEGEQFPFEPKAGYWQRSTKNFTKTMTD